MPVAETSNIVFIATEVLLFRGPSRLLAFERLASLILVEAYLSLNEQNCWLITCQTISSDDILNFASQASNWFRKSVVASTILRDIVVCFDGLPARDAHQR